MTSSGSRSTISFLAFVGQIAILANPLAPPHALAQGADPPDPRLRARSVDRRLELQGSRSWAPAGQPLFLARAPWLNDEAQDPAPERPAEAAPSAEPMPALAQPTSNPSNAKKSTWWVWTSSAALVGLFIAGFAHDLSHEKGRASEEPTGLPNFPDTP